MEVEDPATISGEEEKCFDLRKPLNKTILSLAVTLTIGLIITVIIIISTPKKGSIINWWLVFGYTPLDNHLPTYVFVYC